MNREKIDELLSTVKLNDLLHRQEEEKKKYQDYEKLIDDILLICHIEDTETKNRIEYWKSQRRYKLAVKYREGKKMIEAIRQMNRYGEVKHDRIWKDLLWSFIYRK